MSAGAPPLLSAGALRADGRRPTELRGLRCSTCCSPLHLLPPTSGSSSSSSGSNGTRNDSASSGSDDAAAGSLPGHLHGSSSSGNRWRSGNEVGESLESDSDKGRRKRMRRTRVAASFPTSSAAAAHADGRGVVSLGCTKVAVFVFGPRPLLRGGGGGASGGPWSEGMAAASFFLRAAEEVDVGSSGANAATAGGRGGDRQGDEEEMPFLTERCFDSFAGSSGAGGADSKAALLLCRAGIAPFSSGEVGSSSGERRTVAAGAAAGSGAAAAAAASAAAAAAGGGGGGAGAAGGGQGGGGGGTQQEQELALTVRKILQGVILEESHPRAAISVFIHVLEDDGGVLAASVCAAGLALIEAGIAVRDFVTAVSCVCPPRPAIPLLDPFRAELQGSAPTLTVALLPATEEVVLLQLNGKVSAATFEEMYAVCVKGCREVAAVMRETVREAAARRLGFAS